MMKLIFAITSYSFSAASSNFSHYVNLHALNNRTESLVLVDEANFHNYESPRKNNEHETFFVTYRPSHLLC